MGWRQRNHPAIEGSTRPTSPDTEKWGNQTKSRRTGRVWIWICSSGSALPSTCIMQFGADAGRELAVLHTILKAKRIRSCLR